MFCIKSLHCAITLSLIKRECLITITEIWPCTIRWQKVAIHGWFATYDLFVSTHSVQYTIKVAESIITFILGHLDYNFNTLRPRQYGYQFPDDIFKCLFLNENLWVSFEISLKFAPKGSINTVPALVQIMAWRRPGDKPLSEPMIVIYWRIYALLGLNEFMISRVLLLHNVAYIANTFHYETRHQNTVFIDNCNMFPLHHIRHTLLWFISILPTLHKIIHGHSCSMEFFAYAGCIVL